MERKTFLKKEWCILQNIYSCILVLAEARKALIRNLVGGMKIQNLGSLPTLRFKRVYGKYVILYCLIYLKLFKIYSLVQNSISVFNFFLK